MKGSFAYFSPHFYLCVWCVHVRVHAYFCRLVCARTCVHVNGCVYLDVQEWRITLHHCVFGESPCITVLLYSLLQSLSVKDQSLSSG